ncbi:hypothetical protein [Chryseobacterium sp. MP_3.2]|uniref:hypothetical protein n=1 Tax=Chryseobacterium sp. MP_3.2 TaxID=3071712 RepID=UPI002E081F64|nr:hypothetical protein [Chryseobacterium sp. MP_3.2]
MQIFEEFLEDLKTMEPIPEKYSLGISVDRELFFYVFSRYGNHQSQILLMKEFKDEVKFKYEVEALSKIFECKVYSDTYDLLKLKL